MNFPQALRERRTRSRISQLDLATRAGTTQRHLSFIESGRSAPGRGMVVRLAESLDLPLRERNALLLSAGFAPAYPESPLDGPDLAPVRAAIDHILTGHLPYPAVVVDRQGTVVAANRALDLITEGAAPELVGPGTNAYRLALHPDGLAPGSSTSRPGPATSSNGRRTWASCTPNSPRTYRRRWTWRPITSASPCRCASAARTETCT